jgi:hypothetical protein
MFVWLRGQGFESSVNKVFQKEKLVNSKTKKIYRKLVQQELTWFTNVFRPGKEPIKDSILGRL